MSSTDSPRATVRSTRIAARTRATSAAMPTAPGPTRVEVVACERAGVLSGWAVKV
ncbi:hypothetical protein [Pseudonocardia pini]|uniref:hypothetical protein n=1 Tax=Pseudonocardia pini TaxID=2758030 RepID=UPI0015F04912|nr:hypothetical protein [Pseudonocardia pini]